MSKKDKYDETILDMVKNSLDSDNEDEDVDERKYNILDEDDIEGIEEGPLTGETTVGFTAFNMTEELQEGHFDQDGHYMENREQHEQEFDEYGRPVKKKRKNIEDHDNWIDNIDSIQIKKRENDDRGVKRKRQGAADNDSDSDSEDEKNILFDPKELYKKILSIVQPGETITKALSRLGRGRAKISSAERWKRKKAGLSEVDTNSETITELTSMANELLARSGNLDVYDETWEVMAKKIGREV